MGKPALPLWKRAVIVFLSITLIYAVGASSLVSHSNETSLETLGWTILSSHTDTPVVAYRESLLARYEVYSGGAGEGCGAVHIVILPEEVAASASPTVIGLYDKMSEELERMGSSLDEYLVYEEEYESYPPGDSLSSLNPGYYYENEYDEWLHLLFEALEDNGLPYSNTSYYPGGIGFIVPDERVGVYARLYVPLNRSLPSYAEVIASLPAQSTGADGGNIPAYVFLEGVQPDLVYADMDNVERARTVVMSLVDEMLDPASTIGSAMAEIGYSGHPVAVDGGRIGDRLVGPSFVLVSTVLAEDKTVSNESLEAIVNATLNAFDGCPPASIVYEFIVDTDAPAPGDLLPVGHPQAQDGVADSKSPEDLSGSVSGAEKSGSGGAGSSVAPLLVVAVFVGAVVSGVALLGRR